MKFKLKYFNENLYIYMLILFGLIAVIYYYNTGLITFYNDTTSHLNIARRIVDNLNPGIVQIGSTWLPLLHLLEVPFVWNNFLWQTGLAGTLITFPSYVLMGVFVYKIIYLVTNKKYAAYIGVVALIGNANILYMQATPMFEPLFMSFSTGAVYFIVKWIKDENISNLIFSAIFIMLSSLVRYEGWFYLLFSTLLVAGVSIYRRGIKKAEGKTILFVTLGSLGVFLWFFYNLLIFKNPIYFAKNEYSAYSQQLVYQSRGELPTKGNLVYSFANYSFAVLHNLGGIVSAVFVVSLILVIVIFTKNKKSSILGLLLLIIPVGFHAYSLFHGDTIIIVPELYPYGLQAKGLLDGVRVPYFNIRYGLLMLPAAVVFIGIFSSFNKILKYIFYPLILIQSALFYISPSLNKFEYNFVAVKDIIGSRSHIPSIVKDTEYFKSVYDGGLILASSAGNDIEIYEIGLPLVNYITEGTGIIWQESIVDPSKHARWIIMTDAADDRLGKNIKSTQGFKNFVSVYRGNDLSIYKRND